MTANGSTDAASTGSAENAQAAAPQSTSAPAKMKGIRRRGAPWSSSSTSQGWPAAAAAKETPTDQPIVIWSRMFSSVFSPMPLTLQRSSTVLNGPFDSRYAMIFCAFDGPIPEMV